jgi:amidase
MPLLHNEFTWRIAVEGMVTRTVRDTATAMDYLVRVPNGGTFYPMQRPEGSYAEAARQSPGRLRIALSTGRWGRTGACDPEVADRIRGFARLLESLRHEVVEIDDAKICDWEAMWSGYITQWVCGRVLYAPIAETAGMDAPAMLDALSPMVRRHFEAAQRYSTLDLYKAMACNNAVTRAFGRVMESWDLLLCPTLAVRVPKANGPYSLLNDEPLEGWLDRISAACRYTMPGNESGLPGISLPAGFDSDGLPVGAMLYANYGREDVLLRIAAQIEAAEPAWFARAPKLNVATPG